MKITKIILVLMLLIMQIRAAKADESILSLDQVLDLAYEHNIGLKVANKNRDINEAEVITAGLYPNPQLFASAGIAQRTYNPGIQQRFPLGGKIKRRKEVAKAQFNVIDKSIQQTAIDLRYQVKNLFYEILTSEEKQKVYKELLDITNQTLETAKRRFELKEITILDLNQIELLAIDIRKKSIAIDVQIKKLRNQFSQVLNFDIDNKELAAYENQDTALIALLGQESKDDLIELAIKNRPDYNANEAMLNVNSQELRLARANIYPDLTLGAAPDIVTGDDGSINLFAQLQLDIPVFDRQQGEVKKAKERAEQIKLQRTQIELLIEQEIKNTLNNYDLAKRQLELYQKDTLDKSKELVTKANKSYKLGKTIVLSFLEAVKTSQSIYLGYLDTDLNYKKALVESEKALAL